MRGKWRFSATSVDQLPKMMSSALVFGAPLTVPIPDVDHTDYLLVLGGLDAASINVALASGHFIDSNPLMRSLQADMSFWWSFPKMGVHLVITFLILWFPSKRVLAGGAMLSALYIFLIINNVVVVTGPF